MREDVPHPKLEGGKAEGEAKKGRPIRARRKQTYTGVEVPVKNLSPDARSGRVNGVQKGTGIRGKNAGRGWGGVQGNFG